MKRLPAFLILTIITLVAAILLTVVDSITRGPIERAALEAAHAARFALLPAAENFEETEAAEEGLDSLHTGVANGQAVGRVAAVTVSGYAGPIEVMIGVDTDGNLTGINVGGSNFAETEGGGEERHRWEEYLAHNGAQALHDHLREIDPIAAARLHPNDTRRVIRALEVHALTGETLSDKAKKREPFYHARIAGLSLEREVLYARIDERVLAMIQNGLQEEAEALFSSHAPTAAQALGYKELFGVFRGESTIEEAIPLIQRETRRYAKRQMTWFRRDQRIRWFDAGDADLIRSLTEYFKDA